MVHSCEWEYGDFLKSSGTDFVKGVKENNNATKYIVAESSSFLYEGRGYSFRIPFFQNLTLTDSNDTVREIRSNNKHEIIRRTFQPRGDKEK